MQREVVVVVVQQQQENGLSEMRAAVEELSVMKKLEEEEEEEEKKISTLTFLRLSNLLIDVLDKIGPTMAVLRKDIHGNIERLEELYGSDPLLYSSLEEILEKEVGEGTTKKPTSCSKAVVWLTRSIAFSLGLLERLEKDSHMSLEQMVEETYKSTLKPWHGWISSAAYKVAMKLIPEREIFVSLLIGQGQDYEKLNRDIHKLISLLQPVLDDTNALLRKFRLDKLKST